MQAGIERLRLCALNLMDGAFLSYMKYNYGWGSVVLCHLGLDHLLPPSSPPGLCMSRNVIETRDLSKVYTRDFIGMENGRMKVSLFNRKVAALKNLNLEVKEGEIFGLLGPNGAGKTTTIKILMTIHRATGGTATIMGRPLGDKRVKSQIGFLPENPYFYDYLRGFEFLDYYGSLYGIPQRRRRKKIFELLERVGIAHAANLPLRGYSKGMLQRIGLAQSLLNDPKLVILDEPQSGLDPLGRKEVRDLILSLRDEGKTVCFSSHILNDAEMICDRVCIIHKGELVSEGTLGNLLSASVREVEVVVQGHTVALRDTYGPHCKRVIERENEILFVAGDVQLANNIAADALRSNCQIISFTPRRENLEEFFISKVTTGGHAGHEADFDPPAAARR